MKVLTILGTRPEYLRLIITIKKLDKYFNHKLIWLSQNFEECLSNQFFEEFDRYPDIKIHNDNKLTGNNYIGNTITQLSNILLKEAPDSVIILGDTNAAFSAVFVAKKLGIKIFHAEAGNRCYNMTQVPEEINRKLIDSISDWHLCYTQRSREQLLLEGTHPSKCIVIGNPIVELIHNTINKYNIKNNNYDDFYLITIHRKENINNNKQLKNILNIFNSLDSKIKLSYHPSLKQKMFEYGLSINSYNNIEFITPPNFKEFLKLEIAAKCIITDSGTIPEECHVLKKPCVLFRSSTERPELLESNDMILCNNPIFIKNAVKIVIDENNNIDIRDYHNYSSSNIIKILMRSGNV